MDAEDPKIKTAMIAYQKQLERMKRYYRRNNPNPKPIGRPRKIIPPTNLKTETNI